MPTFTHNTDHVRIVPRARHGADTGFGAGAVQLRQDYRTGAGLRVRPYESRARLRGLPDDVRRAQRSGGRASSDGTLGTRVESPFLREHKNAKGLGHCWADQRGLLLRGPRLRPGAGRLQGGYGRAEWLQEETGVVQTAGRYDGRHRLRSVSTHSISP